MTVGTWQDPDHETQTGTALKTAYDNAHAAARRYADGFAPHEAAPADMTIVLDAGFVWDGTTLTEVAQQTTTAIAAPATDPRIDRIVRDRDTGVYQIVTGTEAASPVPPAILAGKEPVARVSLQTGTAAITNALITDERAFPAPVDRSLHRGHITGLTLSNNGGDPDFAIDIAAGKCRDDQDSDNLVLASVLTKRIDALWSAGTGQGGLVDLVQADGSETVTFSDGGTGNDFVEIDAGTWSVSPDPGSLLIVTGGVNAGAYPLQGLGPASATRMEVVTGSFVAEANSTSELWPVPLGWHYIWIIKRSDTDVMDALISSSATSPTLPANYDKKRRVGAIFIVDISPSFPLIVTRISPFFQRGDRFTWDVGVHQSASTSTTAFFRRMRVPQQVPVTWIGNVRLEGTALDRILLTSPLQTDSTPNLFNMTLEVTANSQISVSEVHIDTDNGLIRARAETATASVRYFTRGYIDRRGQDD